MAGLADQIVAMVESGNILWLAVIAVLGLAAKASTILEVIERSKKRKLENLIDAYRFEDLDDNFKEFIRRQIQKEQFLHIYNVSAEKEFRDSLLSLHIKAEGNLGFIHFQRARAFLDFKECRLQVKIGKCEIFFSVVSSAFAVVFGFLGCAMFVLPAAINPLTLAQGLSFYAAGIFLVAMALFFAMQAFPVYSARLIRQEIEKQHKKSVRAIANTSNDSDV